VRYFFRRRIPAARRILLIESGSRHISEALLPVLRRNFSPPLAVDLITCYDGLPAGYPENTRVFNTADYQGRAGLKRLFAELIAGDYPVLGIICSAEPILAKWKAVIAARLPAKIFVINENGDYFWLDYSNWRIAGYFLLFRSGLAGPGALRSIARLALFPFTLLYLLLYAAAVHLRRATRLTRNTG
jgi:hypothetical protein